MSDVPTARRAMIAAALGALLPGRAGALMAGAAPDTPAARVDANVPGSPWCGVVCVRANGTAYSGVLVASDWVLTASHVAGGMAPAALQVIVNAGPAPVTLAVAESVIYPGAAFPYDDLALLRLAEPLPPGAFYYPIVDTPLPTGTLLTLVGYGASGSGSGGTASVAASTTVKRSGRNTLDWLTDSLDASGRHSPFFVYDFDGASGNGPLGGRTLGNAIETTVASGDSGSPVFVDLGQGLMLYGLSTLSLALTGGVAATAFGGGGGGLVLAHPPYLEWLSRTTGARVSLASSLQAADVPLAPSWALAGLGALLAWRLRGSADA